MHFVRPRSLLDSLVIVRVVFLKYWSQVHFRRPLSSYHTRLIHLSSDEVKMKEDLYAWYQGLRYKEGFNFREFILAHLLVGPTM